MVRGAGGGHSARGWALSCVPWACSSLQAGKAFASVSRWRASACLAAAHQACSSLAQQAQWCSSGWQISCSAWSCGSSAASGQAGTDASCPPRGAAHEQRLLEMVWLYVLHC